MMSGMEMSSMTAATVSSSEVTVYGAVGAVFLFLLVALLLGLSFSSPCKAGDDGKYLSSSNGNLGYDRDQVTRSYAILCSNISLCIMCWTTSQYSCCLWIIGQLSGSVY